MNNVIAFPTDDSTLHGPIHRPGDIVFVDAGERSHYAEVVRITADGCYVIDPVPRAIAACTAAGAQARAGVSRLMDA